MGEKKNNNNNNGEKKDDSSTAVVLKVDMHCDGCASKIIRCIRSFEGVERVKAESDSGKITVTGKVDPTELRDEVAEKMKKKVELISPHPQQQPKKEKGKEKEKENKENNNNTKKDTKPDNKAEKKADDKKTKEPPATRAVLKVALHCQGCVDRIRKTVSKTKGVHEMVIDKEKETVTVEGTMDVKALVENLTERLKRKVEVVPSKKDKDSEKEGGNGGEKEGGNGGGKKKKKKGGGGGHNDNNEEDGGGGDDGGVKIIDHSRMEYLGPPPVEYGYGVYNYPYGPMYMGHLHAPQIFSDENPNACSVM